MTAQAGDLACEKDRHPKGRDDDGSGSEASRAWPTPAAARANPTYSAFSPLVSAAISARKLLSALGLIFARK